MASPVSIDDVVGFWRAAGPDKWFAKDDAFDAEIKARFAEAHRDAAAGNLGDWEATPEGTYALLILLDQFSRNIFRGSPQAFAADPQALAIARRAVARGFDRAFELPERRFLYMPFMHSEALADQQRCVDLCRACGDLDGVGYAEQHRDIVRDFGRFPHRNPVLGRETTDDERRFLDAGGFAG